jgi:hypothetical protein
MRQPYEEYKDAARELQSWLTSSYNPRDGYPSLSASQLLLRSSRANPFGPGNVALQSERQAPVSGHFMYFPIASIVGQDAKVFDDTPRFRWLTQGSPPLRRDERIVHYALVFYGPKGKPYLQGLVRTDISGIVPTAACFGTGATRFEPVPPGVDWNHVSYVLTSSSGQFEFL